MTTKGIPTQKAYREKQERPLSEKQSETVLAILRLTEEKSYPPTLDELGDVFGIDRTSVNHRIVTLLEKGCVTRTGGPRTLVVTEKGRKAVGRA